LEGVRGGNDLSHEMFTRKTHSSGVAKVIPKKNGNDYKNPMKDGFWKVIKIPANFIGCVMVEKEKKRVLLLKDREVNIERTHNLLAHARSFIKSNPDLGNIMEMEISNDMWDDTEKL
jgi:hypothetical protein